MIKISRLIIVAAAFTGSFSYAAIPQNIHSKVHYVKQSQAPKTYTFIITSGDKNKTDVPFDAAIFTTSSGKESTLKNIHTTTPYKITVTEEFVSYMIRADLKNSPLHVESLENGETRSEGWGHKFVGNETAYAELGSGIIVFN